MRAPRSPRRLPMLLLALGLLLLPLLTAARPATGQDAASPITSPAATPVDLPTTLAGAQLAWLLDAINGATSATTADVEAHFDPAFVAGAPAGDIASFIGQLAVDIGPVAPMSLEPAPSEFVAGTVARAATGEDWLFVVGVEAEPPHRISAINLGPVPVAPEDGSPEERLFTDATTDGFPAPQSCGPGASEGCYSNYVRLADLDGDADLDVIFANGGGYFETAGEAGLQPLVIYRNDGRGRFADASTRILPGPRPRLSTRSTRLRRPELPPSPGGTQEQSAAVPNTAHCDPARGLSVSNPRHGREKVASATFSLSPLIHRNTI